jgi:hypothetical protein
MERFLKRHEGRIKGIISGFDRILFKGSLRSISSARMMRIYLFSQRILFKDFGKWAETLSDRIRKHAKAYAEQHSRPYRHIQSPSISKEDVARRIAQKDRIEQGLVCVLGCVELSQSFKVGPNRKTKELELRAHERPCLHVYFYWIDREFGLMHVRLQTWLPFTIQVCLNGWEWLARRLDKAGIGYEKRDNCFAHIEDLPRAQKMIDSLISRKWVPWLNVLAKRVNPWLSLQNDLDFRSYYWTMRESEYSTDVIFKDPATLLAIYPALIAHAIHNFTAKDVLRFLQKRLTLNFNGEVRSDLKTRVEGTRIKHWVDENSIKMYDKQGCVLRIETTINNPRRWRVWRRTTRKGKRCMAWIQMRRGLADIARRAQLCRNANERYLEALSVVGEVLPSHTVLDPISKRLCRDGRFYRPLHPISPDDAKLFVAICSGEFLLHDFRNKDLRQRLYPQTDKTPVSRRQASARISRLLRLLRAHRMIAKVSKSHCYRITEKGHSTMSMALKLRQTNVLELKLVA